MNQKNKKKCNPSLKESLCYSFLYSGFTKLQKPSRLSNLRCYATPEPKKDKFIDQSSFFNLQNLLKKRFEIKKKKTLLVSSLQKQNQQFHYIKPSQKWSKKSLFFENLISFTNKTFEKINSQSKYILIGFIPLLGYLFDQGILFRHSIYSPWNDYLKGPLPGIQKFQTPITELTWETFNYTNYFKKVNWDLLKEIDYGNNYLLVGLNSTSSFANNPLYLKKSRKKIFYTKTSIIKKNKRVSDDEIEVIVTNQTKSGFVTKKTKARYLRKTPLMSVNPTSFRPKAKQYGEPSKEFDVNEFLNLLTMHSNEFRGLKQKFNRINYWQKGFLSLDDIPKKLNPMIPQFLTYDKPKYNNLNETRVEELEQKFKNGLQSDDIVYNSVMCTNLEILKKSISELNPVLQKSKYVDLIFSPPDNFVWKMKPEFRGNQIADGGILYKHYLRHELDRLKNRHDPSSRKRMNTFSSLYHGRLYNRQYLSKISTNLYKPDFIESVGAGFEVETRKSIPLYHHYLDTLWRKERSPIPFASGSDLFKRKFSGYLYPDQSHSECYKRFTIFDMIENEGSKGAGMEILRISAPNTTINLFLKKYLNNLAHNFGASPEKGFLLNKSFESQSKDFSNVLRPQNTLFYGKSGNYHLAFKAVIDNRSKRLKTEKNFLKKCQKILIDDFNTNTLKDSSNDEKTAIDQKWWFGYNHSEKAPVNQNWLLNNSNYYKNKNLIGSKSYDKEQNTHRFIINESKHNEIGSLPIIYKSIKLDQKDDLANIFFTYFEKGLHGNGEELSVVKPLKKDLYETILFNKGTILSQVVFVSTVLIILDQKFQKSKDKLRLAFDRFSATFDLNSFLLLRKRSTCVFQPGRTRFSDFVGGEFIVEEFFQTVIQLQNSQKLGSSLKLPKNLIPINFQQKRFENPNVSVASSESNLTTKFLFVGPPGTGKKLLIKALAGELQMRIILESAERLIFSNLIDDFNYLDREMSASARGILEIKAIFKAAKKESPSILFLDSIEYIGKKREDVLSSSSSTHHVNSFDLLFSPETRKRKRNSINIEQTSKSYWSVFNPPIQNKNSLTNLPTNENQAIQNNSNFESNKKVAQPSNVTLCMLTQLLCELDGLKNRQDILIIGATHRPGNLDLALVRPGRLSKVVYFDLPGKQKRFELLKFYSQYNEHRVQDSINWEYFCNQTIGLSPAHLETAMNFSALKSVLTSIKTSNKLSNWRPVHTSKTMEYGIQTTIGNSFCSSNYGLTRGKQVNRLLLSSTSPFFPLINNLHYLNFKKGLIDFIEFKYPSYTKNKINYKLAIQSYLPIIKFYRINRASFLTNSIPPLCSTLSQKGVIEPVKNPFVKLRTSFYNKHKKTIKKSHLVSLSTTNRQLSVKVDVILFEKYWMRLFKTHFFGSQLLSQTTNSLFRIQQINEVKNLLLYYPETRFFKSKMFNTFKKDLNHDLIKNNVEVALSKGQENYNSSGDFFILMRLAYYIAGKALISNSLKQQINDFSPLSLWSLNRIQTQSKNDQKMFYGRFCKQFFNQNQLDNFLITSIGGKAAETLVLINSNCTDSSTIANNELNKIGWVVNFMVKKNMNFLKRKQLNIQLLPNYSSSDDQKLNKKELLSMLITKFDEKLLSDEQSFESSGFDNTYLKHNWNNIPYWWEGKEGTKNPQFQGEWLTFLRDFQTKSNSQQRSLSTSFQQHIYFKNVVNYNLNSYESNLLNNKNFKNQIQNYNKTFIISLLNHSKTNWNSLQLVESDKLMSTLLFDAFNTCFLCLQQNRDLLDTFAYSILCLEKLRDFEQKQIVNTFLESN